MKLKSILHESQREDFNRADVIHLMTEFAERCLQKYTEMSRDEIRHIVEDIELHKYINKPIVKSMFASGGITTKGSKTGYKSQ